MFHMFKWKKGIGHMSHLNKEEYFLNDQVGLIKEARWVFGNGK